MKAIVLCGGLGTRLGSLTRDTPKPLIPIAGRPFLEYVLDQLISARIEEIVLAVSYQWQKIQKTIGEEWHSVKVSYSIEQQALGTGGAIKQAMTQGRVPEALVVNGDTLLQISADDLVSFSRVHKADIGMALKAMKDSARYGRVTIDQSGRVVAFDEKGPHTEGLINSGVYFVKASVFPPDGTMAFSFEKDILMRGLGHLSVYGMQTNAYFIDIGIPEDLARAQHELPVLLNISND